MWCFFEKTIGSIKEVLALVFYYDHIWVDINKKCVKTEEVEQLFLHSYIVVSFTVLYTVMGKTLTNKTHAKF